MAKQPKKKPAPAKKPAKKKPAKAAAKKPSKPKKPATSKPAATKKPAALVAMSAKPVKKSKKAPKPKLEETAAVMALIETDDPALPPPPPPDPGTMPMGGGAGGAAAMPNITAPQAGGVPAGMDLLISAMTNRGDLRYIIELRDNALPPAMPAPPVQLNVAAPGANPITGTFLAANIVASRAYRVRVFVDPGDGLTPPHTDAVVFVNT